MELKFRKAGIEDLSELIAIRIRALRAANDLSDDADMSEVEKEIFRYYQEALPSGSHSAYLIYDGDKIIGSGNISYYSVMPTYCHPSGRKGYISNMYVVPEYRNRGIARQMLDILVAEIRAKGDVSITLEATEMGRPLYEKYGFVDLPDEMELPQEVE